MDEILIKAGGFLFMIALGFVLKRIGLFSLDDSGFLSKLVLKVTLPMAIIKNFQGLELNRSYLMAIGIGFAVNFIAITVVLLLTRKKIPPPHRAFLYHQYGRGFNIGAFAHCPICPAFLRRMRWHWSACLMSATQLCALGLPSRLRW